MQSEARFWQHAIEHWYAANKRELPWRGIADPYKIWVSEIILQQTQVAQGWAYYERFVARFPDVAALAAAEEAEVLKLWQGLGYYSRARNMHRAARQIMEQWQGRFPDNYKDVRGLIGVGDYTAAAICSFAYNLPCAAVDGNAYRVLSRHFGIATPIDTTAGKKEFAALAQALLDKDAPGLYNQALMDFGATQCTPQNPRCTDCPLAGSCAALAEGRVGELPRKEKGAKVTDRYLYYIVCRTAERVFMRRRPKGDIWQGLYEPLLIESDAPLSFSALQQRLAELLPPATALRPVAAGITHRLTHRRLVADCYEARLPENTETQIAGCSPYSRDALEALPVPRLVEKILQKALEKQ